MTIIAADGIDVEPFKENRFLIGVAETYDVLIQVPESGAYEFRATAHDGSGLYHNMMNDLSLKRTLALTPAGTMDMPDDKVNEGKFDQPGMMGMGSMDMGAGHSMEGMDQPESHSGMQMDAMNHARAKEDTIHSAEMDMGGSVLSNKSMEHDKHSMNIPNQESRSGKKYSSDFSFLASDVSTSQNLAVDNMDSTRPWPPYDKLRSVNSTSFANDKPVREIRLVYQQ
jgi:FtsP/CotA-like multicopper oxidase with cupredoxin domain